MATHKDLFALDLGTTKFCLATLRGGESQVIELIGVSSSGMRRGMVSDFAKAADAINRLLDAGEKQLNCDIRRVVVGIAGSHLHHRVITGTKSLATGRVEQEDLDSLSIQVEQEQGSELREILHCLPLAYRIDTRDAVDNPLGFSGRVLQIDYFVVDADKNYLRDVIRLCNQCGLEVAKLYSEPLASASVTLTDEQKNLGVALADIGGGTTDGVVFVAGRPTAVFTVNIGGAMMTNDLAIGLNLSPEEGERVKQRFGLNSEDQSNTTLEVRDIRGQKKLVSARQIYPVLAARVLELASITTLQLQMFRGRLGAGLILTGGGSTVAGLGPFLERRLGMPVTAALPSSDGLLPMSTNHTEFSPKYATVLGLLNLELSRIRENSHTSRSSWSNRYISQFLTWVRELS